MEGVLALRTGGETVTAPIDAVASDSNSTHTEFLSDSVAARTTCTEFVSGSVAESTACTKFVSDSDYSVAISKSPQSGESTTAGTAYRYTDTAATAISSELSQKNVSTTTTATAADGDTAATAAIPELTPKNGASTTTAVQMSRYAASVEGHRTPERGSVEHRHSIWLGDADKKNPDCDSNVPPRATTAAANQTQRDAAVGAINAFIRARIQAIPVSNPRRASSRGCIQSSPGSSARNEFSRGRIQLVSGWKHAFSRGRIQIVPELKHPYHPSQQAPIAMRPNARIFLTNQRHPGVTVSASKSLGRGCIQTVPGSNTAFSAFSQGRIQTVPGLSAMGSSSEARTQTVTGSRGRSALSRGHIQTIPGSNASFRWRERVETFSGLSGPLHCPQQALIELRPNAPMVLVIYRSDSPPPESVRWNIETSVGVIPGGVRLGFLAVGEAFSDVSATGEGEERARWRALEHRLSRLLLASSRAGEAAYPEKNEPRQGFLRVGAAFSNGSTTLEGG